METEAVPVRTSGARPLLAVPSVYGQGQQPLVDTAWAQPEASQGHGVIATAVSVEFGMHKDVPVHLIYVLLCRQHRVLMTLAANPDVATIATVIFVEVSSKDPVLYATAGVTTRMVEVLRSLYLHFLLPFVYLSGEDATRNSASQRKGTSKMQHLRIKFPAGQCILGWILNKGLQCCISLVREPFKRRDIIQSQATT